MFSTTKPRTVSVFFAGVIRVEGGEWLAADKDNTREAKANDSYYLLIHTPCICVIVECGFLSNAAEAELLVSDEYQNRLADSITDGVKEYFEVTG